METTPRPQGPRLCIVHPCQGYQLVIAVIYFLINGGSGSFGDVAETTESCDSNPIQPVGQLKLGDGVPVSESVKAIGFSTKSVFQCPPAGRASFPKRLNLKTKGGWAPRVGRFRYLVPRRSERFQHNACQRRCG